MLGHAEDLPNRVEATGEALGGALGDLHDVRVDIAEVRAPLDRMSESIDATDTAIAELRDTVDLVARRTALRRRPTRGLFLVHVLGSWSSCHGLVEAMCDCDDFEPIVASIPRRFRGSDGFYGEEEVHRGLCELGVPHLRFGADTGGDVQRLIKAIEPGLVFRQSQWDADVPDEVGTAASDLMVTDGLSMLVEYQLFEKPVIFFERQGHRRFNEIGEQIVRGVNTVHGMGEVRRLVEKFLRDEPDPLREQQQENVRRLFGPSGSVARILDLLRREIAEERGTAG